MDNQINCVFKKILQENKTGMVVLVFKKISRENKHSYAQFLWLCIIYMEAAYLVAAYISKLDLWSQQPIRCLIDKHKVQI